MRTKFILTFISLIILSNISYSQQRPQINFEDLMINAELDYRNIIEARKAALKTGAPLSIYLEEGIFITAKGIENEKPVYAVMKNILHPSVNSEVMFYDEIISTFNLETARINYGNGIIINPVIGFPETENPSRQQVHHLLISESGNNSVMLLDFETGDLVKPDFIPPQSNLTLPKQARLSPFGTITISDQTEDVVFSYDTSGSLLGIFAPSIGPHTGILDNIRGHNYRPNNNLVVCNSQGGNFNRIVEFDSTGEYLGVFIQTNSGGLLSPFDIIFRANDVLVTGSISGAAHRYDLSGNYLDDFVNGQLFPQQIVEFPNGNIGIANFGSTGELKIYDQNGILLSAFSSVSWIRGVHFLGSGNIIVTNSAGVHEIDGSNGNLVRTIVAGVDAQYVSPCEINLEIFTPVELAAFNASTEDNNVNLSWTTSSELNNLGFEVQRLNQSENIKLHNWIIIDFIPGKGTSSELNYYTYEDKNLPNGEYLYRLKQIDTDGSFSFSNIIEVEIINPGKFILFQNYPNPFNPDTRIEFYIPVDGYVSLKIYNSIGEEISVPVSEYRIAGRHSLTFSDENLPSGLYFYSLTSGSFFETRKMILMK